MQSTINKKEHYWIISYEGDTTGLMPGPLPEIVSAVKNGALEIVIDLNSLRFLNSTGIKAFKESSEIAREHHVNLGFACPTPSVRRALKLSGLSPRVPIYYTQREALNNLDLLNYKETAAAEQADHLLLCQHKEPFAGELRKAVKAHAQVTNFRMIPVRDMDRALKYLQEEKVDCILIDATFPAYKIIQFIENVETNKEITTTPILVVTKDKNLSEAEILIRNGAHEVIRMPFQPIEVVIRLQTVISFFKDHRPHKKLEKGSYPRGWRKDI